jgi:GNAT superfamily N-acetyltransferase
VRGFAAEAAVFVSEITIRPVTAAEVRPLRSAILRAGRPAEESIYPGDDEPEALHAGAFAGGEIIGVASVFREPPPGEADARAWRLRGMALVPAARRKGHGRALLEFCFAHVSERGGAVLWCNARSTAVEFYRSLGFHRIGEEFETPDGIPHFYMRRPIT